MPLSFVPRICVVGTRSGVGKSLVVTGLLLALRRRGLSVACCVTGTALQQATVYSRLTGRYVRCLDSKLLSQEQILNTIGQAGVGADLLLIDGQHGLYDGSDLVGSDGSDAEIASATSSPCILVLDTDKVARSLTPVVGGFANFPGAPLVEGVILSGLARQELTENLNVARCKSDCDQLLSPFGLPPCVGCIPARRLSGTLPDRRIVQAENTAALPLQLFNEIEDLIKATVDIDALESLASPVQGLEYEEIVPEVSRGECKIAVARDNCFHVCYQDNLDLLSKFGAEIVPFSPLADSSLPAGVGGVYIPGGCLSEYAQTIEQNGALLDALREFVSKGGVLFSEGSGTALLCQTFKTLRGEEVFRGAGILPFEAVESSARPAFATATLLDHSIFGDFGGSVRGLVTGEWGVQDRSVGTHGETVVTDTLRYESRSMGVLQEGYSVSAQSCCTFAFLHFGSNPEFARALVRGAAAYQQIISRR